MTLSKWQKRWNNANDNKYKNIVRTISKEEIKQRALHLKHNFRKRASKIIRLKQGERSKEKRKKTSRESFVLQTPQLIDCRTMKVQLAILQNVGNLQNMKSIFQFHCFMLFQMRTIYNTIHIPLVWIVGANTTLVEPTYKHPNL